MLHSDHSPMSQLAQEGESDRDRSLQSTGRGQEPEFIQTSRDLPGDPSPRHCFSVCLRATDSVKRSPLFHMLFASDWGPESIKFKKTEKVQMTFI